MVLLCTMCDVKLPNPGKISYPGSLQLLLHNLIPGVEYPEIFCYPVKASIHKSAYCFESNSN